MRIGIITFSAAVNYGAILQTYGLLAALRSMGHDVHVINYKPKYLTDDYSPWGKRPGLRSLIHRNGWQLWADFILYDFPRRSRRRKKFEAFAKEFLNLDNDDLATLAQRYDMLVCGSDQIWNPRITGDDFDPLMFGIAPSEPQTRVIAYAGSLGNLKNVNGVEGSFKKLLNNMKAISCREQNLTDFINRLDPKFNAVTVLDPTLLAGREAFEKIATNRLIKESYLLHFDLCNDLSIRKRAQALAKERSLKFIELTSYHEHVDGLKLYPPASPAEFVSLIKYADVVTTTSFHGTVFSIMFQKNFLSFDFFSNRNERIVHLLEQTGLLSRYIKYEDTLTDKETIDWEKSTSLMDDLRNDSIKYLTKSLSTENGK